MYGRAPRRPWAPCAHARARRALTCARARGPAQMTAMEALEHRIKLSGSKAVKGTAHVQMLSIEGRGHK